jgi:hypothetical protein
MLLHIYRLSGREHAKAKIQIQSVCVYIGESPETRNVIGSLLTCFLSLSLSQVIDIINVNIRKYNGWSRGERLRNPLISLSEFQQQQQRKKKERRKTQTFSVDVRNPVKRLLHASLLYSCSHLETNKKKIVVQ